MQDRVYYEIEPDKALDLLQRVKVSRSVINHSKAVAKLAISQATKILNNGYQISIGLVETGSLLHDIGRAVSHKLDHGVIGGQILRNLSFKYHARIAETHVLAGLKPEEAEREGLPPGNYIPHTREEIVVCYSDKRFSGTRFLTLKNRFQNFFRRYGKTQLLLDAYTRSRALERQVELWMKKSGK